MAVPAACFLGVMATCLLGIIIGSFYDFRINEMLANKTELGAFFATYGSYFSYCLYPAAGSCFFAACIFVLVYAYNRIHMTNHFLSDVCFGTLITYIIYAVISEAFLSAARAN